jgi:hypothetical protein
MTLHLRPHTPVVPDTDRPPAGRPLGGFPHHAVRLIPIVDAGPLLTEQAAERSPINNLHVAHERLSSARHALAGSKGVLGRAEQASEAAQVAANQARETYERARADARRAELVLRQEQRRTEDAKLALRQAYESVARLEGLSATLDDPAEPADPAELGAA